MLNLQTASQRRQRWNIVGRAADAGLLDFLFRVFATTAQNTPSLVSAQPYKAILERDETFFSKGN